MKRSYVAHSILVIGSLIFAIILAEGALQSYGLYLDYIRSEKIDMNPNAIRILALGESTTDIASAPEKKPWTSFLEDEFRKNGNEVKVLNVARLGISTHFLLQNLPEQIKEFKPHLIVGMIGVNDVQNLSYLHDEAFFSKLKLVRIFRSMRQKGIKNIFPPSLPPLGIMGEIRSTIKVSHDIGEITPEVQAIIKKYPEYEWFTRADLAVNWFNTSREEQGTLNDPNKLRSIFDMATSSLKLNPLYEHAVRMLIFTSHSSRHEARETFKDILRKGYQLSPVTISWLGKLDYQSDPELKKMLENAGVRSDDERSIEATRKNFFRIHKLAKDAGIRLAIMGYPATDPEIYKLVFDRKYRFPKSDLRMNMFYIHPEPILEEKYRDIIFIDNSSMPRHFDKTVYTDLMLETPQGSFGHTTKKGHYMIAMNAWKTLTRELPELFPQKNLNVSKSDKFQTR